MGKRTKNSTDNTDSVDLLLDAIQFTGEESQQKEILSFTAGVGTFTKTSTGMKGYRVHPGLADTGAVVGDYITKNSLGEIVVVPKNEYEVAEEAAPEEPESQQ